MNRPVEISKGATLYSECGEESGRLGEEKRQGGQGAVAGLSKSREQECADRGACVGE